MRLRSQIAVLAAIAIVTSVAAIAGCSSNKTTNPPATTPDSFDSGNLTAAPFKHTFMTKGTYGYRCKYHGGAPYNMVGTVVVDPLSANTSASVSASNFSFSPPSVTVKPGSMVSWTLAGGGPHTATRP